MNLEGIKKLVEEALDMFMKEENYLIENNLRDGTIIHRLAMHLEMVAISMNHSFNWDVDVEYNNKNNESNRININSNKSQIDGHQSRYFLPDIIFHRRGKTNESPDSQNNLLIIEIKKNENDSNKSNGFKYIKTFLKTEPYNFCYGLSINFITGEKPGYELEWFERDSLDADSMEFEN